MTAAEKRCDWIDALKAFLVMDVLFDHLCEFYGDASHYPDRITVSFITCIVPTFYFLSAFLLSRWLPTADGRVWVRHTVAMWRRVMVPMLVFFFITYDIGRALDNAVQGCFLGMYFLFSIFVVSMLNVGLVVLVRRFFRQGVDVALILSAAAAACVYIADKIGVLALPGVEWSGLCLCEGNIYYVLGMLVGLHRERTVAVLRRPGTLVALCTLYVCGVLYLGDAAWMDGDFGLLRYKVPGAVTGVVGVFALTAVFMSLDGLLGRSAVLMALIRYVSRRSLPCYIMGWFVILRLLPALVGFKSVDSWTLMIGFYCCVLVAVMALHDALCRIPGVERWLFGRRRPLPGLMAEIKAARAAARG